MHKLILTITMMAGLLGMVPQVHAQSRAGVSGVSVESMQQAACLSSVRRLETMVTELEDFANSLQACNDDEQVFNGVQCVDLATVEHQWLPDTANPTELVLLDNGVEVTRVAVLRGNAGPNASCPAGTEDAGGGDGGGDDSGGSCTWDVVYAGAVGGMPSFDVWCGSGVAPGSNQGRTCTVAEEDNTCGRHDSDARGSGTTTGRVFRCNCD